MSKQIFSPEWLDELKARCGIVEVISRYVPLKHSSRDYVGVCPFHNEKTPSFMVNEAGQYYHCFGCGESGDIIKFIQKYDNIPFYEAVQKLAEFANIPMPAIDDESAKKISQKKSERDQMIKLLRDTAKYYLNNLYSGNPQAKVAREYLQKRQISKESMIKFGIGCSVDFDSVIKHLSNKGYSLDLMKKAGIVSENDNRCYDAYGKRLIFPLINTNNEVLGFSGRLLEDRDLAKYKNTTQTLVFNKSEVVFAINLLKKRRDMERKEQVTSYSGFENVIIVEGQIDVISMHQYGFTNTVACLGTALTPMHARKLKQFSDNIILLMDGDEAGKKAALRSIDTLRNSGLNVRVVTIPDNHDPDEYLKLYGASGMQELLQTSTEGIEYKIKVLANKFDLNSLSNKSKFIHEALLIIKMLNEEAEQDVYLKLVQQYSGVSVDVLRLDLQKINIDIEKPYYERNEEEIKTNVAVVPKDAYTMADQFVLASLLYQKPYANLQECLNMEFVGTFSKIFDYIKETSNSGGMANISGIYSRFNIDEESPEVQQVVNFSFAPDPLPEFYFKSCVLKNIENKYLKEKQDLETKCGKIQDKQERNNVLNRIFELAKLLKDVNEKIQKVSLEHNAKMTELEKNNSRLKNKK